MNQPQFEFIDISTLTAEDISAAISLMTPSKRERVTHMAREDDRRRSAAAEHLARRMVSRKFGLPPEQVTIGSLESGQPMVVGLPCHISLSHSGRWAMCALSDHPVGADIEVVSGRGQRAMSRVCAPAEQEYILASGEFDPVRFTEVWTAKEACVKRTGAGLSGGLSNFVTAGAAGLFTEVDGCRLISGRLEDAVYAVVF